MSDMFRPTVVYHIVARVAIQYLLTAYYITHGEYIQTCYGVQDYSLCLSTNNSGNNMMSWSNAKLACETNNSVLVDVADKYIQSALQKFRTDSNTQLSNKGNWIMVFDSGISDWHWIDGQPKPRDNFKVENQNNDNLCAAISNVNGQAVYWGQLYSTLSSYICQLDLPDSSCTDGFKRQTICYKKYNASVSWFDASNSCVNQGGSLAIFADLGQPKFDANLTNWLNNASKPYWIGLVRQWWTRTNSTGATVDIQYSNWRPGRPPNPTTAKGCVLVGDGINSTWQDFNCNDSPGQRYVCQVISYATTSTITKTTTIQLLGLPVLSSTTAASSHSSPMHSLSTSNSSSASSSNNVPIIAGVVGGVGGAAIIAVIVVIVVVIKRNRVAGRYDSNAAVSTPKSVSADKNRKIPSTGKKQTSTGNDDQKEVVYADMSTMQPMSTTDNTMPDVLTNADHVVYAELQTAVETP